MKAGKEIDNKLLPNENPLSLYPILAVNFVGTLGFGIVLPFLIFLVTRFGGNAVVYGIMGATYSAFQLIGAPVLGRWSDIYGRRKILLLSQLGTLLSWFIFLAALY
ncbi:MAG: MFS transporter, partial [Ignavibacteriaceae bacterium]